MPRGRGRPDHASEAARGHSPAPAHPRRTRRPGVQDGPDLERTHPFARRKGVRRHRGHQRRRPRRRAAGEFVVFVGPSGCGKSTLLRMIAGLEDITAGDIVIDGKRVNDLPPVKRGIAMVFQSYALYPHMTVFENIAFRPASRAAAARPRSKQGRARRRASCSSTTAARAPARAALRRPAPARRHRPRHRARAAALPVRRAALQPRRRAARPDAHRDRQAAPATSAPPWSTSRTTRSRR